MDLHFIAKEIFFVSVSLHVLYIFIYFNISIQFFTHRYCDSRGLLQPRAQCDPGYVCYGGAYSSTPTDGATGELCPAGGYCVIGTFKPIPCPPGRYSNTAGATNDQDCRKCDPGYYCKNASQPKPDGPCFAGYYCESASETPTATPADVGHFAPEGSSSQQQCLVGTYQPHTGQGSCLPCREGYYCDTKAMNYSIPCTAGNYCPEGSEVPQFCPPGTYNNFTVQKSESDCKQCPSGKYCDAASILPTGMSQRVQGYVSLMLFEFCIS